MAVLDASESAGQRITRQNHGLVFGEPGSVGAQLGQLEPMIRRLLELGIVGHVVLQKQLFLVLEFAQNVDVGIVGLGRVDVGDQEVQEGDEDEVSDGSEDSVGVDQARDEHLARLDRQKGARIKRGKRGSRCWTNLLRSRMAAAFRAVLSLCWDHPLFSYAVLLS